VPTRTGSTQLFPSRNREATASRRSAKRTMLETLKRTARLGALMLAALLATLSSAAAIYGGRDAPPRAFPFMVSLYISITGGDHALCGGTLIADQWVLTAAHCLVDESATAVDVFAGSDLQWQGDRIKAQDWKVHPGYDTTFHNNDLALIHLSRAPNVPVAHVKWSTDPNRFPDKSALDNDGLTVPVRRDVTAIGWGLTTPIQPHGAADDGGGGPQIIAGTSLKLQMLEFRVASSQYCSGRWLLGVRAALQDKLYGLRLNDPGVAAVMDMVDGAGPRDFHSGHSAGVLRSTCSAIRSATGSSWARQTASFAWASAAGDRICAWTRPAASPCRSSRSLRIAPATAAVRSSPRSRTGAGRRSDSSATGSRTMAVVQPDIEALGLHQCRLLRRLDRSVISGGP
jgi:hypothetical protein